MIKWVFVVLSFALILWLGKIIIADREELQKSVYNPISDDKAAEVIRGAITDRNGLVMAETVLMEDGLEYRAYPYGESAAHILGYLNRGRAGLEAYLSDVLLETPSLTAQIGSWARGEKLQGKTAVLTLDAELQQYIYSLFGDYRGACVVSDPRTGEILALVSAPSFDPSEIGENYEAIAEREDSPLFPRATLGLYPPGSTFKTITSIAMMRNMTAWRSFRYDCHSILTVDDQEIGCHNYEAHGSLTVEKAYAESCNGFFGTAGMELGPEALRSEAEKLMLHDDFGLELEVASSSMNLSETDTDSMLARTAIGQGETLMTPFYIHMLTSLIAGRGTLMQPHLVYAEAQPDGTYIRTEVPKAYKTLLSGTEVSKLYEMMEETYRSGTASEIFTDARTVLAKTGTAEVGEGNPHSWFTGFVLGDSGEAELALTVLVEHGYTGKRATPMAGQILEYIGSRY